MNDFLNPKSMSTPGAAGALMMLIANALCNNFPEIPFRYVALIFSFAIGAVVFSASAMKIWERGIYWVVNSLIIFSMGIGATNIAANVVKQPLNEMQHPQQIQQSVPNLSGNAINLPESNNASFTTGQGVNMTRQERTNVIGERALVNKAGQKQDSDSFFRKW